MKKVNLFLIIFVFLVLNGCEYKDSQELRVRILANSNSSIDQIEKIAVKNEFIKMIKEDPQLINARDYLNIENKLLKRVNLSNQIKVECKKTLFPAKSLDGKFIPSGEYMTLLITLGEGKGDNWWSILYPDFFNTTYNNNNEVEYRSFIGDLFSD